MDAALKSARTRIGRSDFPVPNAAKLPAWPTPAYSADAAGVNVLGVARWAAFRCVAAASTQVLDLGEVRSLRSRLGRS